MGEEGVEVEVSVQDYFSNSSQSIGIDEESWQNWFCTWLETLQPDISANQNYELSLRLTDDAEIQLLNAQYRQKNQPTDVLAFAALEVDCPQPEELLESLPLYLGDIAISVDTAQRQAQQQGHSWQTEVVWLAAHGLLHLLGWDHPDEDSLNRMLDRQSEMLEAIGFKVQGILPLIE